MIDSSTRAAQDAVDSHSLWYHTMELAPGVVTPGWFDLRPIVNLLPWPDVRGKRCLDVGTWDGFFAFELERRGAAEVVATDISDQTEWDWCAAERAQGPEVMARMAGPAIGEGFRIARELIGSSVRWIDMNVYDLAPERVGSFDVVVCGSLMLHLRDPVRALEAIRGVCRRSFLSAEQIALNLTARFRRRAVADFSGERGQWWVPNTIAHRRMVGSAGFAIERATRPYAIPYGPAHPAQRNPEPLRQRLIKRVLAGGTGVPHAALLARPAL